LAFVAFCSGSSAAKSGSADLKAQESSAFAVDATTLTKSVAAAAVIDAHRAAIAAYERRSSRLRMSSSRDRLV
jgi:hypothetical protein